jgi:hypothetical protein
MLDTEADSALVAFYIISFNKTDREQTVFPPDEPLARNDLQVPNAYVTDNSFRFSCNILKPHTGIHKNDTVEKF